MPRRAGYLFGFVCVLLLVPSAMAQDSQAAATTRKRLATKITIDIKEVGTKAFLEELNLELDKPFRFIIDNASGVSNNTKMTYKGKDVPVGKILNDLADKYDWGYIVKSDPSNNKVDGAIVIRKSSKGKERGYEAGKGPKKAADKSSRIEVNTPWSDPPRMIAAVSAGADPAVFRRRA